MAEKEIIAQLQKDVKELADRLRAAEKEIERHKNEIYHLKGTAR